MRASAGIVAAAHSIVLLMIRLALTLGLLTSPAMAQNTSPGLLATLTDGSYEVMASVPTPNFHLEQGESLHPQLAPAFKATFTGELRILEAGEYRFQPEVAIDGRTGSVFQLKPGAHAFRLRYTRPAGTASFQLRWMSARFPWEPVPGSAYSHAPVAVSASEQGRTLVQHSGCVNCHAGPGTLRRSAPALDAAGSRLQRPWVFRFLATHAVRLDEQQRADAAAFLDTVKSPREAPARRASEVDVGKGGELFGVQGCSACHTLGGLGSKYRSLAALADQIRSRHIPSLLLDEGDDNAMAAHLMRSESPAGAVPAGDTARGRSIVESLQCGGCHLGAETRAKPLVELASSDCPVIQHSFTPSERSSVSAFLSSYRAHPDRSPAPVYEVRRMVVEQRCIACHQYESTGPTATLLEGVPPLTGVGQKLKTAWIGRVLWDKARVRTGREIRMPNYSEGPAREWPAWFAKADGVAPGNGEDPPSMADDQRKRGHSLLGAMACIGCHDWGKYKALGEEGPDLITAGERMRFEWYERWMRNPARILSGTSMPPVPNVERARLLWAAVEAGPKLPVPEGYLTSSAALGSEAKPVPAKEAIVIRWDMPEATPAAIAVGLPGGKLSYCFDAGAGFVRYAWRGGFLDMSGTLLRKTDKNKLTPTAGLLGDVFYRTAEPPIRIGEDKRIPRFRFRGYRLLASIPEFRYEVDDIEVRETLTASANGIHRMLVFSKVDRPVWFEGKAVPRGANVKVEAELQ